IPDVVVLAADGLHVFAGDNAGNFGSDQFSPLDFPATPLSLGLGDFNQDGYTDVAVLVSSDATPAVWYRNLYGGGFFHSAGGTVFGTGGSGPAAIAVTDLDLDGQPDIAIGFSTTHEVRVYLQSFGQFTE